MIYVRFEAPGVTSWLTRFYFSAPEWRVTEIADNAHAFESLDAANAALEAFGPFAKADRAVIRFAEGGPYE